MNAKRLDQPIYINGVNGSTGKPLLPKISTNNAPERDMTWNDLYQQITIKNDEKKDDLYKLAEERNQRGEDTFGVIAGIDPAKLEEAGWGIVYAKSITKEIKDALFPLVERRRTQANKEKELFKEYQFQPEYADPQKGFRAFMSKNNTAPRDDADPEEMPYYILLVGDPQEIPYIFQYSLDVNRAVGRIYFDTVQEYENYATSVVTAEKEGIQLPRQAAFFGVTNEGDTATKLSTDYLIKPLYDHFNQELSNKWLINSYFGEAANKAQLQSILGGNKQQTPAFLLTGSHGIGFDSGDNRQLPHQGALLCSDWVNESGYISEEKYMAGAHIDSSAQLHGLIAFFFACYGAGTPQQDDFMGKVTGTTKQIAPKPLISKLPQRMLSHPRGGALAVIGHVDRAWTYSFMEDSNTMTSSNKAFQSTLTDLFNGVPIGHAFDYLNRKHASTSVELANLLDEQRRKEEVDEYKLIDFWRMNHDARDYIILGDPAVRLCINKENEQLIESSLKMDEIDLSHYQPGSEQELTDKVENKNDVDVRSDNKQPSEDKSEVSAQDLGGRMANPGASGKASERPENVLFNIDGEKGVADVYIINSLGKKQLVTVKINLSTYEYARIDQRTGDSFGVIGAESMGIMDSKLGTSIQDALQKFSEQISIAMRDISTLEVLTYMSVDDLKEVYDTDNKTFRDQAQLKAVTLLSLDGDVKSMVPGREVETVIDGTTTTTIVLDTDLLQIHKEMVALAQENQSRFFKNIIEVAATLVKISS